jgi:hypothetical protein
MNHLSLVGKSTKIRLLYIETLSIEVTGRDQVLIKMNPNSSGHDLRSEGKPNYPNKLEYIFKDFEIV